MNTAVKKNRELIAPDGSTALKFLRLVCGGTTATFQTFSDIPYEGDEDPLARTFHGDLKADRKLWDTLCDLNGQGAAICISINEMDGSGKRDTAHAIRLRAYVSDLDGAPLKPVLDWEIQPHIIVESSPDKFHNWYLVAGGELQTFSAVQTKLAKKFNGDLKVKDIPRAVRIPGFVHYKGEPFLSRIHTINEGGLIGAVDFIAALGGIDDEHIPQMPSRDQVANDEFVSDEVFADAGKGGERMVAGRDYYGKPSQAKIEAALWGVDPDIDRQFWIAIGYVLYVELDDYGLQLWAEWSSRGAKYKAREMRKQCISLTKKKYGWTVATLFWAANQASRDWWHGLADEEPEGVDETSTETFDPETGEVIDQEPAPQSKNSNQGPEQPKAEAKAPPPEPKKRWPEMDPAAYHGITGRVVETFEPHTEADPNALLIQFLIGVGSLIGRTRFYKVESTRHYPNLFGVVVADTAQGKGTSIDRIKDVLAVADEKFIKDRVQGGLSSGEGLIDPVRDPVEKWDKNANDGNGGMVIVDQGESDKRLLVVESEFSSVLTVMTREGNTISQLIRLAWDSGNLQSMTRSSSPGKLKLKSTAAHISIIGHITPRELLACMTDTDKANGFANRILFAIAKRSKLLPFGGDLTDSEVKTLGDELRGIVDHVTELNRPAQVTMTDAARTLWGEEGKGLYRVLKTKPRAGMLEAICGRAVAQVTRLALIYALLDKADQIDVDHIKAAVAVWNYCEDSAAYIFGDSVGDHVADTILGTLRQRGGRGMTRTEISNLFGRHTTGGAIQRALAELLRLGKVRMDTTPTKGKSVETWFAV
jgi:hypothetical protein